jgi:hypothetical protein
LRDAVLRRFDVPVEFRAVEDDVALVLCHGRLKIVPLISLRRVGEAAWDLPQRMTIRN